MSKITERTIKITIPNNRTGIINASEMFETQYPTIKNVRVIVVSNAKPQEIQIETTIKTGKTTFIQDVPVLYLMPTDANPNRPINEPNSGQKVECIANIITPINQPVVLYYIFDLVSA